MGKRENERYKRLSHRIHTRITREKYEQLNGLVRQSQSIHSLSELLRNILNDKKIIVQTYDASLDKVMTELSGIRKELQAIGVNINQVTHRFHIEDLPEGKLFQAMEIAKLYQQTDLKVTELFNVIAELSRIWLPE